MLGDAKTVGMYTDLNGLQELRRQARDDPQAGLRAVAQQFESIFLQMMLKSMRAATPGDDLFNSQQGDMYRDLFDGQIAMKLSERGGIGLADVLVRQLGRQLGGVETPVSDASQRPIKRAATAGVSGPSTKIDPGVRTPAAFVQSIWKMAERAAGELGTAPEVLIAQAALESGWGRSTPAFADGRSTHNLFGIKADSRWDGPSAEITTSEFRHGVMLQERAAFRAYESMEHSFNDYVQFLRDNPRYHDVLTAGPSAQRYAEALRHAGYATDPDYADKMTRIVAGDTLRQAVAGLNL